VSVADQRARDLRRQIIRSPGHELQLAPRTLVAELFEGDEAARNGDGPALAQAVLAYHGVEVKPRLTEAAGDEVLLRTTPRFALQGAIATALVFAFLGLLVRPLYGLLFAVAGGIGAFAAARWAAAGSGPARRFAPGRTFGVAAALVPLLIVLVLAVPPLRAHYRKQHQQAIVGAYVQAANRLMAHGDLKGAAVQLMLAENALPGSGAIANARAQLDRRMQHPASPCPRPRCRPHALGWGGAPAASAGCRSWHWRRSCSSAARSSRGR